MDKRYLWVVEMKEKGEWVSTAWCGINRADARKEQAGFIRTGNGEETRIRKYVPEEK